MTHVYSRPIKSSIRMKKCSAPPYSVATFANPKASHHDSPKTKHGKTIFSSLSLITQQAQQVHSLVSLPSGIYALEYPTLLGSPYDFQLRDFAFGDNSSIHLLDNFDPTTRFTVDTQIAITALAASGHTTQHTY
jgi:hypothetical protein